jgi:hypothetical protein
MWSSVAVTPVPLEGVIAGLVVALEGPPPEAGAGEAPPGPVFVPLEDALAPSVPLAGPDA